MNRKLPADDLFEKSSMSFGEHLEELRNCLLKAFIWLVGGTLLGLTFANSIVKFVETPLQSAIRDFHIEQAETQYEAANGRKPSPELAAWMVAEGLIPDRVMIDTQLMLDTAAAELEFSLNQGADEADQGPSPKVVPADAGDADAGDADAESDKKDAASRESVEEKAVEAGEDEELDGAGIVAPEANPWTDINIEKLRRLRPLLLWRPIPNKLISLSPIEGFMIWLKAGLVAGVIIGSPGIFWHIWQFFAAGLYPHERRYVYWYLPLSLVLFLGGVSLAFFVVFEMVLSFLMTYSSGIDVEFTPRLNDYMSFALFLPLGFGIAFQLPIVMLGLHRFGVISVATYVSQWRIAVLAIAFLSMMLSPPDIYSMFGLFLPLVALYFFGIALCKYMPQGSGIGGPAIDPE